MSDTLTICGRTYICPDACSFGDYGGSGSIGLANIRAIIDDAGENVYNIWMNDLHEADDTKSRYYESDETAQLRAAVASDNPPDAIHANGHYSSEAVYVRSDWERGKELIDALEQYPSLDDDAVSSIEIDWEHEAWETWLRYDLEREAWPENHEPDNSEAYDVLGEAEKFEAYRHAMELCGEYPEPEYNGVYIRVERIAATYRETIEKLLAGETLDTIRSKAWPEIYA